MRPVCIPAAGTRPSARPAGALSVRTGWMRRRRPIDAERDQVQRIGGLHQDEQPDSAVSEAVFLRQQFPYDGPQNEQEQRQPDESVFHRDLERVVERIFGRAGHVDFLRPGLAPGEIRFLRLAVCSRIQARSGPEQRPFADGMGGDFPDQQPSVYGFLFVLIHPPQQADDDRRDSERNPVEKPWPTSSEPVDFRWDRRLFHHDQHECDGDGYPGGAGPCGGQDRQCADRVDPRGVQHQPVESEAGTPFLSGPVVSVPAVRQDLVQGDREQRREVIGIGTRVEERSCEPEQRVVGPHRSVELEVSPDRFGDAGQQEGEQAQGQIAGAVREQQPEVQVKAGQTAAYGHRNKRSVGGMVSRDDVADEEQDGTVRFRYGKRYPFRLTGSIARRKT